MHSTTAMINAPAALLAGASQNVFEREPIGAALSLAMIAAGIGLLIWQRHRRSRRDRDDQ